MPRKRATRDSSESENAIRRSRTRERKPKTPIVQAAQAVRREIERVTRRHVPEHVRQRFVNIGHVYYFPDGAKAFEDHGRRLSTPSENVAVIESLIAIAEVRGWRRISVQGSEKFRREAWQQALARGILVRGYAATSVEKARLAQRLARERPAPTLDPIAKPEAKEKSSGFRVVGDLVEFGSARYRHASRGPLSYFATVKTEKGERTLWGRDLERAIAAAQVKPGDPVTLVVEGRDPVTVRNRDEGEPTVVRSERRYRNRWAVEKVGKVGTPAPPAPDVQSALTLRQAELLAAQHLAPEKRAGFLEAVKTQLAERRARGAPPPEPRLRERPAEPIGRAR